MYRPFTGRALGAVLVLAATACADRGVPTAADTASTVRQGAAPAAVSAQGLVAYYPFEGDASDASGNGHDGALHNGVGFGPGPRGTSATFASGDQSRSSTRSSLRNGIPTRSVIFYRMAVTVRIPTTLRPMSGGNKQVEVAPGTLSDVIAELEAAQDKRAALPDLRRHAARAVPRAHLRPERRDAHLVLRQHSPPAHARSRPRSPAANGAAAPRFLHAHRDPHRRRCNTR